MGYTTEFKGAFQFDEPLTKDQVAFINAFAGTRRMIRDEIRAGSLADHKREAVGLPVGNNGCYFVGGAGCCGQDDDVSVLCHNTPPPEQPGLWCQWVASEDGTTLQWNESEKFRHYTEWLEYLIENFFKRWCRVLSGSVTYQGEDHEDVGTICVENNSVKSPTALGGFSVTTDHISLTHNFRCPNCNAQYFGSRVKDGVVAYYCHGSKTVRGCRWSGPAEACFTAPKTSTQKP